MRPSKLLPKNAFAQCLALVLAACSCPCETPIEMTDDSARITSARVLWRPDTGEWQPGETTVRDVKKNVPGFELQFMKSSGQGNQQISSGYYITNGRSTISGPREVEHRADLNYMHAVYNGVTRYSGGASGLELEWFAGLGIADVNVHTTSTGVAMNTSASVTGIAGGIEPRWNFNNHVAVECRFAVALGDGSFVNTDVALRYRPFANFAVHGGYAFLSYQTKSSSDSDPGPNIRLRGPYLGLNFFF